MSRPLHIVLCVKHRDVVTDWIARIAAMACPLANGSAAMAGMALTAAASGLSLCDLCVGSHWRQPCNADG